LSVCGLVAILAVALALPSVGLAQSGHGANAHHPAKAGKKGKKKKKSLQGIQQVLVHCAATVTCPGFPGPAGKNGLNGANGANGAPGHDGTTIGQRFHGAGPMMTSGSTVKPYPLANANWTQPAGEFEWIYGQLNVTEPTTCGGPGQFSALLFLDQVGPLSITNLIGITIDPLNSGAPINGGTRTLPFIMLIAPGTLPGSGGNSIFAGVQFTLFDPGVATPHSLSIQVTDGCSGASQRYRVNSADIAIATGH
jgi:hypothetical protein